MFFHYIAIISLLNEKWPFIWIKLNCLYQRIDPGLVFLEKKYFHYILLSPLEKGHGPLFEQT